MPEFIVTGGAGFIGCNIVKKLNTRGVESILIVDDLNHPLKEKHLKKLKYQEYIDKRDFIERLESGKYDDASAIFHMGACSDTTEKNAQYLKENNTEFTLKLARWAIKEERRLIYASSASTYGNGENGYSDEEEVIPRLKPLNLYGQSKQDFDMIALKNGWFSKITGFKFFNVFGPEEDHKGQMRSLVHKAYHQILQTGRLRLFKSYKPEYCDGGQVRDFVYVDDVVAIMMHFLDNPSKNGIFNCGTGYARSWLELGNAVFAAMGKTPDIEFIEMPLELRQHYQYFTQADLSKLRRAGCAHEFISLENAVRDYICGHLMHE